MSTILDIVQLVNQFAAEAQQYARALQAKTQECEGLKKELEEAKKPKSE